MGRIFAIMSGKGGVGKSTLSASLAEYFARAGKTVAQLINASGCFANNYFAPTPIHEIHLKLPGLTGKEKPATLRGGTAVLREANSGYGIVLNELKDYETIILE